MHMHMRLRSVTPVHVACALLLVASCAGAPAGLPSQPTPASLVAFLQSCQTATTADSEHEYHISSCAFLAPSSTVTLQPGPPATLPLHTTLIGAPATGPLQATCCDPSNSTVASPLPVQHTNAAAANSNTTSLPQLDLSRLAPSSLVVPPNGTLSLHNLTITAAQLPAAPYPLPSTSFLSLLAIRLSPGARLQLSSITITTPSCAPLVLHQDLACRAAPSPNFTITPTSLLVHSYTTTSLSAQGVLLTCSGRQLPAPCSAAVVRSGVEVLRAAWAWEQAMDSLPVPLYLYVQGTIQLSWLVARARSSSGGEAKDEAPSDKSVWEEVENVLPGRSLLPITRGTLVLGGPPDRSSVLDLSGSASLWDVQGEGAIRLQHLTMRGLPLGPPEGYPEALLRLPMWYVPPMLLPWVASTSEPQLAVVNVTVELPTEEVAFWRNNAPYGDLQRVLEVALPGGADNHSVKACIMDDIGTVFADRELATVPGCSSCMLAVRLETQRYSRRRVIRDTLLVPPPLLSQPQQDSSTGALTNQQSQQGHAEKLEQQAGALHDGLRLPPAPSTPLCALAPGPGMQEAELLYQLIIQNDLDRLNYDDYDSSPPSALPSPSSPSTPSLSPWWQGPLPPPLLRHLFPSGVVGFLYPDDLSHLFIPTGHIRRGHHLGPTTFATVLAKDAQVDTRNSYSDTYNFLRSQAVIDLPGTLLLGDPVRTRTLDLAGLPSAVVLEREPLTRSSSMWPSSEVNLGVLLPFLETVRQQRQAAGLRGLLTEPVSLTVRHLVLINLPAAGPFVRILPPPRPPVPPPKRFFAVWALLEEDPESILPTASPNAIGAGDVRVASRGLQQAPQPSGEGADATRGAGALGSATRDADYLGGLAPLLANLTSCVWSLQLDRAAVMQAVRDRLQQGGTGSGSGGGSSGSGGGGGVQSPVDVSYVLLQSVQLVVPERELLLLAWAWATNATRHAEQPSLAEQLQLMLDGSRLAGGVEAELQQLLQGPTGGPGGFAPALPAGLRLVFDQFVWCGLLGTNVTLTSQLPGPTDLVLQLPDLDLPVAYGTGPGDDVGIAPGPLQDGDAAAPGVPGGPPFVLLGPPPSPGAGAGDQAGSPGAPAAVGPGGPGPSGAGAGAALPPDSASSNGSVQQPDMADVSGGGKGRGALPAPLGLAVGLAVGCAAILLGICMVVVLIVRRKRATMARDKLGLELTVGYVVGARGCFGSPEGQDGANGGGAIGADGGACSGQQQGSCSNALSHQQHSGAQEQSQTLCAGHAPRPRVSPWVLRQMAVLRLNIEGKRQLVLGPEQQQQREAPYGWPSGTNRKARPSASATPAPMPVQQRVPGGAHQLGSGGQLKGRSTTTEGGTGSGSLANLPSASPVVAQDEAGGSLSLGLDLSAAPSGGGGTDTTAATDTSSGLFMGAMAEANATAGRSNGGTAGGEAHSNSSSSSGPPLVLLRELGRGAQGVVYAGRWRGLDVAVKNVLVQRLGGSLRGAMWHGPSLHSALAEGSISSAMSHPHVVATYATYVQGPEGEEQVVVGEHGGELGAAGAAVSPSLGQRCSNPLPQQSTIAASALETVLPEGTCELHGDGKQESREDSAATELKNDGCKGTAAPSALATGAPAGATLEPAEGQEQQPRRTTQQLPTVPSSGLTPTQSGQDYTRSASTQGQGVAGAPGAQVQVWKLTLVQELCTGGSLRDSLLAGRLVRRGGGPWPRALHPAAALRLALHMARGSAHLHRHGVLWNDLSSANVLLQLGRRGGAAGEAAGADSTGSSGALDFVAKVADFGLSRRLPEGATHASETAGRSGLYVAPEVVRYGRCTPASDVYAYGVLLWEVAAGVPLPELLSQPEGGAVRSWLAQQAFVPPEEAEALPAELLAWPGAGQQRTGGRGPTDGIRPGDGTNGDGDGAGPLPAGYVALAVQCLRQDPRQRPSFEDVCLRLERISEGTEVM